MDKDLERILEQAKEEHIEPETIRELYPNLSEEEFNQLQAIITVYTSNYAFENFYAFENVIRALNGIIPDVLNVEGNKPEWIWAGCAIMEKLRPKMELSHECKKYIQFIFEDNGIYFLPPLAISSEEERQVLNKIKDVEPNGDGSFLNRQASHLIKLKDYYKSMDDIL